MPGTVLGAGNIEMTNKNLCQDWGKVEQSKEYEDIQGGGGVAIFNEILVWAKFSRGLLGNVSLSEKKKTHGKMLSFFFLRTLPRGCNVWNSGSHLAPMRSNLRRRLKC